MRKKVFVAMSGGVDSSVSAALLQKEGYDITGVFMAVWSFDAAQDKQPFFSKGVFECTQTDDRQEAMRAAAHLGIPFLTFDFEKEYKEAVVDYMIREYTLGRTPNPDVSCNKHIKFGLFLQKALELGADFIATGHYARVQSDPNVPNTPELSEGKEKIVEKELSYKLTGIFFEIQKEIGRFCRERQYADMFEQKLKERGVLFRRESREDIGGRKSNILDFIVEDKIVVELKAKPYITKEDYYQISRYIEPLNIELGLLVNFRQEYLKPKRVLNSKLYKNKFGTFGSDSEHSGRYTLLAGVDKNKDQSYFLWTLGQEQLRRTLFPVGDREKSEVRKLAKKFGLPNAERKDSQGVCFLGEFDMKDFLKHYISEKRGNVLNEEGEIVGHHAGAFYFTLGERHGFTITKKTPHDAPYYVVAKDVTANTITVSNKKIQEGVNAREVVLSDTHFVSGEFPDTSKKYSARTRYRQPLASCSVRIEGGIPSVVFDAPRELSAPGQSLVLYDGDVCLGGGIIA